MTGLGLFQRGQPRLIESRRWRRGEEKRIRNMKKKNVKRRKVVKQK